MPHAVFKALWHVLLVALLAMPAVVYSPSVGSWSGQALAQGAIREIRVEGNRRVEPETVRSYLKLSVGDAYDAAKANDSIRSLFATGLFSDVKIDRTAAGLLVTVVENPTINIVAFEGNRDVDTKTLQGEVQLKSRAVYTRGRALSDVQRILDVYRRQGRFAATVEPKLIELDNNRVNVVYEINEGTTTKVKAINFIGNRAFSDSQLRDIITTSPSGWFDFLKGNTVYDPDRLNLDRELLRQYYLKNGYADIAVIAANAELDRDGSGFFITFSVDEGQLYTFGDVRIESSLPALNIDGLKGLVLTQPGATFNASDIDKTTEKLTLAVSEQGFAFARVRPRTDRNVESRTIELVYQVEEGPRVYIERINIVGNSRTKDHVIRREFRLAEGDAFNPLLVENAKKRLQQLGFFKSVDVRRRPGSADDRVVLDVVLEEQPTGELSFGAGYSTSEGVIGDIAITERNLLGNGQFLRLKLAGSVERFQIDLSFTEPRFLDRNLSAGFDLFHKDLDQLDKSGFKSRKTGGSLRFGFPLSEYLWVNTNYTLSYDDIYEVDSLASLAVRDGFNEGAAITSSIGSSIVYDKRNHPRNPNSGYYLQLGTDFAGLGGDVQYVKVQGEGRVYYPVTEQFTLVGRAVAGHIEGWGGDDIRLLDLFYKGGETIRGFDRAGYGPRDLLTNDALGGKTFWAVTAELRFPLPFVPEELGLSGALFADAGSLYDASTNATKLNNQCGAADPNSQIGICLADDSSIRASVGASILWQSPLGPLRLDYAFPLQREDYDETQRFRFGASTRF